MEEEGAVVGANAGMNTVMTALATEVGAKPDAKKEGGSFTVVGAAVPKADAL